MLNVNTPQFKQPPPQGHPFRFKPEKALEALLYLTNRLPSNKRSRFFLNKYFFYADLKHLEDYSRYIAGDFYVAMTEGPVPSNVYNMLKEIAGTEDHGFGLDFVKSFRVSEKGVFYDPIRQANTDVLSPSDIECLEYVIENYSHLSKDELSDVAHEAPAYKIARRENGLNRPIKITQVTQFIKNGEALYNSLTGEK